MAALQGILGTVGASVCHLAANLLFAGPQDSGQQEGWARSCTGCTKHSSKYQGQQPLLMCTCYFTASLAASMAKIIKCCCMHSHHTLAQALNHSPVNLHPPTHTNPPTPCVQGAAKHTYDTDELWLEEIRQVHKSSIVSTPNGHVHPGGNGHVPVC